LAPCIHSILLREESNDPEVPSKEYTCGIWGWPTLNHRALVQESLSLE